MLEGASKSQVLPSLIWTDPTHPQICGVGDLRFLTQVLAGGKWGHFDDRPTHDPMGCAALQTFVQLGFRPTDLGELRTRHQLLVRHRSTLTGNQILDFCFEVSVAGWLD